MKSRSKMTNKELLDIDWEYWDEIAEQEMNDALIREQQREIAEDQNWREK